MTARLKLWSDPGLLTELINGYGKRTLDSRRARGGRNCEKLDDG